MADRPSELERITVVVVGSFNPAIFHPSWFALHSLVRDTEAEEGKVEFVTSDASAMTIGWFTLQALDQRLSIHTDDTSKFAPLRDLVIGILSVLEHTPVKAYGLNYDHHVRMIDEDDWHGFGHYLAPKRAWEGLLKKPGTKSLVIEGGKDGYASDAIRVRVEPSGKVKPNGVFINVHQHFPVSTTVAESGIGSAAKFCDSLAVEWNQYLAYCKSVVAELFRCFDSSEK